MPKRISIEELAAKILEALKVCPALMGSPNFTFQKVEDLFGLPKRVTVALQELELAKFTGSNRYGSWSWVYEGEINEALALKVAKLVQKLNNPQKRNKPDEEQKQESPSDLFDSSNVENEALRRLERRIAHIDERTSAIVDTISRIDKALDRLLIKASIDSLLIDQESDAESVRL